MDTRTARLARAAAQQKEFLQRLAREKRLKKCREQQLYFKQRYARIQKAKSLSAAARRKVQESAPDNPTRQQLRDSFGIGRLQTGSGRQVPLQIESRVVKETPLRVSDSFRYT